MNSFLLRNRLRVFENLASTMVVFGPFDEGDEVRKVFVNAIIYNDPLLLGAVVHVKCFGERIDEADSTAFQTHGVLLAGSNQASGSYFPPSVAFIPVGGTDNFVGYKIDIPLNWVADRQHRFIAVNLALGTAGYGHVGVDCPYKE